MKQAPSLQAYNVGSTSAGSGSHGSIGNVGSKGSAANMATYKEINRLVEGGAARGSSVDSHSNESLEGFPVR